MNFLLLSLVLLVVSILGVKFSKPGSFINNFSTPFAQLFSAIFLGIILLPIGFIWDIGKSIYETRGIKFFKVFGNFIKEILLVIAWLAGRSAVAIDKLGNVVAGEFLEDVITSKEDTHFRESGITISSSTGDLERSNNLNKTGIWFSKQLDKFFEPSHAIRSIKFHEGKIELNEKIYGDLKKK